MQKKSSARAQSASGSEPSDDDEAEGEVETTHQIDVKRARRLEFLSHYLFVKTSKRRNIDD